MNVLMGKVEGTSGSLLINGKQMEMTNLKKLIGYVPQDDIMIRDLSVRENILHCARVRMPYNFGSKRCSHYVDAVIKALK